MEQWIQQTLSADRLGLAILPASFLLGFLGAVSSCCTLPVFGAVVGYAGSLGERPGHRGLLALGLFFMAGTVLALAALGAVSGFIGQVAVMSLGKYWRFAAGLLTVLFGLVSLRLLHFRAPKVDFGNWISGRGVVGPMVYGLVVGGATTACSITCNPLLLVAVGAATLKGSPLLGATVLAIFALGYSLPLTAGLIGFGFGLGRLGIVAQRIMPAVRICSGILLVAVGFYLLATV